MLHRASRPHMLSPASGQDGVQGRRDFRAGDVLALPTDGVIGLIAVGAVRLDWTLGDGRRQVLGFRFRGDVLAPPSDRPDVQAAALTAGVLYEVDERRASDWRQWEAAELAAQTVVLGKMRAIEKIATFLLLVARRRGGGETETAVELPMGREDIADFVGLNAETVSRMFSKLRAQGIIELPAPSRAVIRDPAALRALTPLAPMPRGRSAA